MDARRARRLLLIAFAISLLVHALLALRMNWPFARPREETQIVSLEHRARVATITKVTPTPPPATPAPSAAPVRTAAPVRSTKSAQPLGAHGKPAGEAPRPAATTAPTPVPTVAASGTSCAKPETNAALVTPPSPPPLAPGVRASATNAVVRVHVALDARGTVTDASVEQSSGNGSLDLVAVSMARGAEYAPAYRACKAIAGTYTFSARFIPW